MSVRKRETTGNLIAHVPRPTGLATAGEAPLVLATRPVWHAGLRMCDARCGALHYPRDVTRSLEIAFLFCNPSHPLVPSLLSLTSLASCGSLGLASHGLSYTR